MSYDRERLRQKMVEALDEFIPPTTLADGRVVVIDEVTDVALDILKFICGDSDGGVPRGILGYPVVEHQRCADPACALCTGRVDVVFGNPLMPLVRR